METPKSPYLLEIINYGVNALIKEGISNAKKEIEWFCQKKLNIPNLLLIEENEINGGSYRIYCRKYRNGSIKLNKENVLSSVKQFVKRIKKNRLVTMKFINKKIKEGKKIFLYGASTKGNTVLQYYGMNFKKITYAAERSPEKWNKYTIGTGIKIISEKQARKLRPDYFFVTPWGFIDEFVKRESTWIKKGGKFIVPFPKFRLVK